MRSQRRGVGVAASLILAVGLAIIAGGAVNALAAADEPAPTLIELAACAAATPLPPASDARTDGATIVSFQVPAVVRLRVDDGRPTAAATNTGCAPRAADHFLVGDRAATPGEATAALAAFRTGDWRTPGAWHTEGRSSLSDR